MDTLCDYTCRKRLACNCSGSFNHATSLFKQGQH